MKRHRMLLAACVLVGLTGCTPKAGTHDPGYVAKEWSMTMREFGIVPVFPPREDVQVGDIYLSPVSPDQEIKIRQDRSQRGQFVPLTVLVGAIDLRNELSTYYAGRMSFPPTPNAPSTQPAAFLQPHADSSVFVGGDNTRLRLGGFPEFFSTQISRGGIDGLVPTEALDIAFGAFGSANKTVRVSVPMVESYGLPLANVLEKFRFTENNTKLTFTDNAGQTRTIDGQTVAQLFDKSPLAGDAPKTASAPATQPTTQPEGKSGEAVGYLRLITEVYVTRAIDISVDADVGRSGGVNLRPTPELLSGIPSLSATTKPSTSQPAKEKAQPADFNKATPQQVAAALTNQLNESLQAAVPGVSVKYLSVTAYGVSMRRTFERPIVIGYRGVLIAVNRETNALTLGGVIDSSTPTAADNAYAQIEKKLVDELTPEVQRQFGTGASVVVTVTPPTPTDAPGTPTYITALVKNVPTGKKAAAEAAVLAQLQTAIIRHADQFGAAQPIVRADEVNTANP